MVDLMIARALSLIIVGCMTNVLFLEVIIKLDPASGGLITLSQFLFVSLHGLSTQLSFGSSGGLLDYVPRFRTRTIPLWVHVIMTLVFFSVSTANNWALNYNISMPLHMVFRASSLMASLLIGYLMFEKRYTRAQFFGVLLVSVGVVITTLADANVDVFGVLNCACGNVSFCPSKGDEKVDEHFNVWLTGIAMLTFALFGSALLGHLQEWSYRKWGRDANEGKFYSHALSLPYFYLLTHNDISTRISHWNETISIQQLAESSSNADVSPLLADFAHYIPSHVAASTFGSMPVLYVFLIGNVMTQFVCISGVYQLTAFASTLTCTMALTVRKFLSLVLSVWLFSNPFSEMHWIGAGCVFLGVLQYSQLFSTPEKNHQKVD